MKQLITICFFIVISLKINAQATRVAILDFENISGIAKYDGLGKAMSSMLISDVETNVSPKRLQLVERAQIQKILKEQNFQASGNVNKNTAVQAGKILGVNYLLVGDVFILNDQLIINARLTNTETGDIVFSKKQEGKTVEWLTLKTSIAKDLATSLSQPFIEPTIPDKEISVATITTFGNAVAEKDSGNFQMAETLSSTLIDFNPEFRYVDDLKKEIDELKKQVAKNTADIKILTEEVNENVTDYLELGFKYSGEKNFAQAEKYFLIGFNKVSKSKIVDYLDYVLALSKLYYYNGKYTESLKYSELGLEVYPYFKEFMYYKYNSLGKLNRLAEFDQIVKTSKDIQKKNSDSLIIACLEMFSEKYKVNYYDIEKYLEWKQDPLIYLTKAIRVGHGEFYFNEIFAVPFNKLAIECIQEVYNNKPEHAASLLKQLVLSNSSFEVKFSVAWYTMLSGDFLNARKQWDDIVINVFCRIPACANYGETMMVKVGILKNSVVRVKWVYDKKNDIVYQDSIREYHPNGTIRYFNIPEEQRDTIKLKNPYWYYEYDDGRGFVTTNPIEAYLFKANTQYPLNSIIDCIKTSNCMNATWQNWSFKWGKISEDDKMAIINWGHSYLLSGDSNTAIKIYQLFPSDFKFSEDFRRMTYAQVLKSDWSDFLKSQLISKDMIEKMHTLIMGQSQKLGSNVK